MASITSSGHWVPPGPSKNASARSRADVRFLTASTSKATALMGRAYVSVSSGRLRTVKVVQRLRTLSEAECYARCYGWRGRDTVEVTKIDSHARADKSVVVG